MVRIKAKWTIYVNINFLIIFVDAIRPLPYDVRVKIENHNGGTV
jgi:hypothetical protein